jgi:hypothetical protein
MKRLALAILLAANVAVLVGTSMPAARAHDPDGRG